MGGNFVWCATGIYYRTFIVQNALCDLFFIMNENDYTSYADDNAPNTAANTIDEVIKTLEHDPMTFPDNQMKDNLRKCHS